MPSICAIWAPNTPTQNKQNKQTKKCKSFLGFSKERVSAFARVALSHCRSRCLRGGWWGRLQPQIAATAASLSLSLSARYSSRCGIEKEIASVLKCALEASLYQWVSQTGTELPEITSPCHCSAFVGFCIFLFLFFFLKNLFGVLNYEHRWGVGGGDELVRVAVAMTSYQSLPSAFLALLSQIMKNYFLFFFFYNFNYFCWYILSILAWHIVGEIK